MPAPPGRLIVPTTIPEPSPEPVAPATVQTPARQNTPAATRPAERSTPPPTATPPPPEPTPSAPPPVLLTTPNAGDLEQKARNNIAAAQLNLQKVVYKALSPDAKVQFDTAQQYIGQAEDALKIRNYVFAGQLAEKAATLASLLVKSQGQGHSLPLLFELFPLRLEDGERGLRVAARRELLGPLGKNHVDDEPIEILAQRDAALAQRAGANPAGDGGSPRALEIVGAARGRRDPVDGD